MARTKESDDLLKRMDNRFRQLLNEQFKYANDTERNRNVKNEVGSDVWNLFRELLESDRLNKQTKEKIEYIMGLRTKVLVHTRT